MKLSKLFTFTMAALALGACSSNDDDLAGGTTPAPVKGETIDAISIAFSSSTTPTRASMGEIDGTGTENNVYVAYVFAKENDPQHEGKKLGDWTVKRVVKSGGDDDDAKVTTPIAAGDIATPGTKANMCTFNGVQQGDSVYVIVNDPNMNMATANTLAHQGANSQAKIRAYVSTLSKDYLNGLSVGEDGKQTAKFIMAGAAAIPTNPNTPNGGTVIVPVYLDREVAKVFFNASVSTDPQYEATGQITLKDATDADDADGILVVRIPNRVSPFTKQVRDWYFPLSGDNTTKDWNADWLVAFDGDGESVPGTPATADVVAFNKAAYQSTAKEYRLTWKVKDVDASTLTPATATSKVYINGSKLYSPYFYVAPNYANHSGCGTVIITQATYTGANTLLESTITDEMLANAVADATFSSATSISDVKDIKADTWNTEANLKALVTYFASVDDYKSIFRGAISDDDMAKAITIQKNDKRYYRADVANMSADNSTSMKLTERNTFYHITGTITTMGAKTIDDAADSDDINMIVQVVVKKWNYVVNNVNM